MRCDAELCSYWTGQGCICAVMDLPRCICSGDQTGESIDERPDCPRHGENRPPDFTVWDSEEAPFWMTTATIPKRQGEG
jgi:hypothetical protein